MSTAKAYTRGDRVSHPAYGRGTFCGYKNGSEFECFVKFDGFFTPSRVPALLLKQENVDFHVFIENQYGTHWEIKNSNEVEDLLRSLRVGDFFDIKGIGELVVFRIEPYEYQMTGYTYSELTIHVSHVQRTGESNVIRLADIKRRIQERRERVGG